MNHTERMKIGFRYLVRHVSPEGIILDEEVIDNVFPTEAANYLLNAGLNGATQISSWYIGLYGANYTAVVGDTLASFLASASEITNYSGGTRVALTPDAVANGTYQNSVTPGVFTFSGGSYPTTVYGGFICSQPAIGNGTGTLLSAVKFSSAKTIMSAGELLRVVGGLSLVSV